MSRRMLAAVLCTCILGTTALTGCDGGGGSTGTAPEAHDTDTKAGHMVHPAGGPNSPDALKAKKAEEAPAK